MLEVRLKKRIGSLQIDAELSVPPGVTVLFGPSGAGKSSILRMIAGLLQPDSGEISISGRKVFNEMKNIPTRSRNIGFVFQDGLLFPHMTVEDNLKFAAAGREPIEPTVAQMDLQPLMERRPGTLSGGERQRVAIARALLGKPQCLLMDEPLASLDQQRKDMILPHLKGLKGTADIPVIYVTHSVGEAFRLADQIVLIQGGKTGISGPPDEVFGTIPDGIHSNPLAGGLLSGELVHHHPHEYLSEVRIAGSSIFVALTTRDPGTLVRVRLEASDISIASEPPASISILNRLPAQVSSLVDRNSSGIGVGLVLADGQKLAASVTRRAARSLDLKTGDHVLALFKTVSVTPEDLD